MKQIDKDALVAEIEKICSEEKAIFDEQCRGGYEPSPSPAVVCMKMEHLLSFLDTLEVKEVNLDEEADNYWETLTSDVKDFIYFNDFYKIAKHFFELGMLSTITEEDCKLIWNIGDDLPYMSEEEFFKELLRRYKAQKGE